MEPISKLMQDKGPSEPPQVSALKQYAREIHEIEISVFTSAKSYLIRVPNGAIAQKFRLETAKIMKICDLDKPLVIHIG